MRVEIVLNLLLLLPVCYSGYEQEQYKGACKAQGKDPQERSQVTLSGRLSEWPATL